MWASATLHPDNWILRRKLRGSRISPAGFRSSRAAGLADACRTAQHGGYAASRTRATRASASHSAVEFRSQNWWTRSDRPRYPMVAGHRCSWLHHAPTWGGRSESNRLKRVPQTRPAPFGFGHHWSWSSESNTRRRGTSSLHCHCARPANVGAAGWIRTSMDLLTSQEPFYVGHSSSCGGGGENCTPDDLLCRQTPCCLGYTASIWSGVRESHPCSRPPPHRAKTARGGDPGLAIRSTAPVRTPLWSEQRESNSRHRVGGPRHQPLYHARSLAVATGIEPVPPDRQSGILPTDATTAWILRRKLRGSGFRLQAPGRPALRDSLTPAERLKLAAGERVERS